MEFQISRAEVVFLAGLTNDPRGRRTNLFGWVGAVRVHQTDVGSTAARQTSQIEEKPTLVG